MKAAAQRLTPLGEAAVALAKQGVPVFPLARGGKIPAIPKKSGGSGHRDATSALGQVREWWSNGYASANIGVRAGRESGLVFLDLDKGVDETTGEVIDGFERFHEWSLASGGEGLSELDGVPRFDTPRGGAQFVFGYPSDLGDGWTIPKQEAVGGHKGLDVRGDGGYSAVPPSVRAEGRYEWVDEAETGGAFPTAPMPSWLVDALKRPVASKGANRRVEVANGLSAANGSSSIQLGPDPSLPSIEALRPKLFVLDPDPRDDWMRFGAALHDAYGAAGFALWDEWSAQSPKYDTGEQEKAWRSFGREGFAGEPCTVATIAWNANQLATKAAAEPQAVADGQTEHATLGTTDTANADRLVSAYGENFRWVPEMGAVLVFTRGRWAVDKAESRVKAASKFVARRVIPKEAAAVQGKDKELAEVLRKWAKKSESAKARRDMAWLARTEFEEVRVDQLDQEPSLLNVRNGTVDLKTGKLRRHDRRDLLTNMAPVEYDPAAACPMFEEYLARVLPDEEVREYVQRTAGAGAVGLPSEFIVLLCGTGANGKTSLLEALRTALGTEVVAPALPGLLLKSHGQKHPTEIADLRGKRIVYSSDEVKSDSEWDVARVKMLSGGDTLKARGMHQDPYSFPPTHSLWLSVNTLPLVSENSHAFWRRVVVVPFEERITAPEVRAFRDRHGCSLREAFERERAGILRWIVEGARKHLGDSPVHGSDGAPTAVLQAIAHYREKADPVGTWLDQRTRLAVGSEIPARPLFELAKDEIDTGNASASPLRTETAWGRYLGEQLGWQKRKTRRCIVWVDRALVEPD